MDYRHFEKSQYKLAESSPQLQQQIEMSGLFTEVVFEDIYKMTRLVYLSAAQTSLLALEEWKFLFPSLPCVFYVLVRKRFIFIFLYLPRHQSIHLNTALTRHGVLRNYSP